MSIQNPKKFQVILDVELSDAMVSFLDTNRIDFAKGISEKFLRSVLALNKKTQKKNKEVYLTASVIVKDVCG